MDPQRLDVILPTNVPWNASNLTRLENPEMSAKNRAILVAVIALQMVTGSVLNTLVILLFLMNVHLLQVPSNLIVFSLSSSDFISSSIFLPFHLYTVSSYRSRSVWVKKLDGSLAVLCFNAGINGILSLTGDRFLAVVGSMRYSSLVTLSKTRCILAMNWCIALTFSVLHFLLHHNSFYSDLFIAYNFSCLVIILFFYAAMFCSSQRQIQKIFSLEQAMGKSRVVMYKRLLKSIRASFGIVFVYVVTYFPFLLHFAIIGSGEKPAAQKSRTIVWSLTFVFWNSCINPLLYCWLSKTFRVTIKRTFSCFVPTCLHRRVTFRK